MDAAAGLAKVRALTVRLPHNVRSDALDNRERYARSASGGWNGFSTRTPEYSWPAFRSSE